MSEAQRQADLKFGVGKQVSCSGCGGIYFDQVIQLKIYSKLSVAQTSDALVPGAALRCYDCGEVLDQNTLDYNKIKDNGQD